MNAAELKKAITDRYSARYLRSAGSHTLLNELARLADLRELDHSVYTACYGILWSVQTGRLSGTIAIYIRDLDAKETFQLVADVVTNCPTIGDVPGYLAKKLG